MQLAETLTTELRRRRFARGALRIETPELNFSFDGQGGVERAWLEGEPHAHMLVEELMILANECVGRLLSSRRREALYRVHERPDPQSIGHLVAKLAALGVPTPPVPDPETMGPQDAARAAARSGARHGLRAESGRGREAFTTLVLRSLKQARYHPQNLGHMGLASPAYCHFTSPIRRYPDLVVHRALLRDSVPPTNRRPRTSTPSPSTPRRASARGDARVPRGRPRARLAARADALRARLGHAVRDGEITGLIGSGLFVRFGEVFEGFLPVRRLGDDYYELDELGTRMQGRRGGRAYRLGDEVVVEVADIRRHEGKVELRPG